MRASAGGVVPARTIPPLGRGPSRSACPFSLAPTVLAVCRLRIRDVNLLSRFLDLSRTTSWRFAHRRWMSGVWPDESTAVQDRWPLRYDREFVKVQAKSLCQESPHSLRGTREMTLEVGVVHGYPEITGKDFCAVAKLWLALHMSDFRTKLFECSSDLDVVSEQWMWNRVLSEERAKSGRSLSTDGRTFAWHVLFQHSWFSLQELSGNQPQVAVAGFAEF